MRPAHRVVVGIDEEARPDAGAIEPRDAVGQAAVVPADIEPALGGDLLALLGHQGGLMRLQALGDVEHLLGAGHFEVEHRLDAVADPLDVGVLDVAAILAEVGRDAVGAGAFAEERGGQRIGVHAAPCLSEGRDVIDVDVEALAPAGGAGVVCCSH